VNAKVPCIRHHRSEFDRVMGRPHIEVPHWLLKLLAGVIVAGALALSTVFVLNTINTPTVWFEHAEGDSLGRLVKVQIGKKVIYAEELTQTERKKILSGSYDIEYVDPREVRK